MRKFLGASMKKLILIFCLFPLLIFGQTRPSFLQLKDCPIRDVRFFGAKGDGVTSDTAAFIAGLASGSIYVPAGTYVLDPNVLSLTTVGQSIIGDGKDRTILKFPTASGTDICIQMLGGSTPAYQSYQKISDLTILGSNDGNGVNVITNAHFTINNVKISSFLEGLILEQALIFRVRDCEFLYCLLAVEFRDGPAGFNLITFKDTSFLANTQVVRCDLTASSTYGGASGVVFDGCQVEANGGTGVTTPIMSFSGNIGGIGVPPTVTFINCWFERNTASASEILFRPTTEYPTGLTLMNNQFYSVDVDRSVQIAAPNAYLNIVGNGLSSTLTGGNEPLVIYGTSNRGIVVGNTLSSASIAPSASLLVVDASTFIRGITLLGDYGLDIYAPGMGTSHIRTDGYGNLSVDPITSILGLDGGLRLEFIATSTAQINTLFLDVADGKLKFKDASGAAQSLY